ncbi:MAG: hypothetical protein GXY50_05780 [Syntrophomonadaceae bacterium]|nr:hypothetical protein [Syntrophomonadaceae bacterium]
MKRTVVIMLIFVLLTVLAAGCSGDDNNGKDNTSDKSPVSAQVIEPNQLISKEVAEELIGAAVADVQKSEQEAVGVKQCMYEFSGEASDRFLQVTLNQQSFMKNPNPAITPKSMFDVIKDNFEEELVVIEGIGDEAFIATPGLHVLAGDYYMVIAVGNTSHETNRDILKAAGAKAVENLELLTN